MLRLLSAELRELSTRRTAGLLDGHSSQGQPSQDSQPAVSRALALWRCLVLLCATGRHQPSGDCVQELPGLKGTQGNTSTLGTLDLTG